MVCAPKGLLQLKNLYFNVTSCMIYCFSTTRFHALHDIKCIELHWLHSSDILQLWQWGHNQAQTWQHFVKYWANPNMSSCCQELECQQSPAFLHSGGQVVSGVNTKLKIWPHLEPLQGIPLWCGNFITTVVNLCSQKSPTRFDINWIETSLFLQVSWMYVVSHKQVWNSLVLLLWSIRSSHFLKPYFPEYNALFSLPTSPVYTTWRIDCTLYLCMFKFICKNNATKIFQNMLNTVVIVHYL